MAPSSVLTAETLYRDLFRGYQLLARLPSSEAERRSCLLARLDELHVAIVQCRTTMDEAQGTVTLALLDQQLMSCLLDLSLIGDATSVRTTRDTRPTRAARTAALRLAASA